jgi:hypothetical protein
VRGLGAATGGEVRVEHGSGRGEERMEEKRRGEKK